MTDLMQILKKQNDKQGENRVLKHRDFYALLKGRHKDVFMSLPQTREVINSPYITVNTVSLIAKKQADLMFLKPVKINVNNKHAGKILVEILNKNGFTTTCYKQAITASTTGGCVFRIRWGLINKYNSDKSTDGKEKNNQVIIEAINPENAFFEIQNDKPVACTLKYIEKQPVIDHKTGVNYEEYYIEEHYEPGKYTKSVYLIKQTRSGFDLVLLETPKTIELPFSDIPVVYIPNALETGFYGVSDFDDKLELIHEINNTLSRISSAVRRYTYPILVATEDWIKKAKARGSAFPSLSSGVDHIRNNGEQVKIKVEEIGVTAAPRDKTGKFQDVFKFIDYNPDLKNIHDHLENCTNLLLKLCSISPALLDTDEIVSGKALKLKLTNTLIMIEAKKTLWTKGLKDVARISLLMHGAYSKSKAKTALKISDFSLEWGNVFNILDINKTDETIKKVNAGLMSKKRAVMELESVSEKEAEEFVDEITDSDKKNY